MTLNTYKRIISLILAAILVLTVFAGCRTEHYASDDIVLWAEEYIGNDVVISDEPVIRESGLDGYDDLVWSAYRKSLPEVEFEIFSHRFYGGESINYSIETTYWYEYGRHYFEQYKEEYGTDLVPYDAGRTNGAYYLLAGFADRDELSDIVRQAISIEEYMYQLGGVDYISFRFEYDDILAMKSSADVSDFCAGYGELDETEEILLRELAMYAADYRLLPDTFTDEELEAAIDYFDRRFEITRADGSVVSYSDLTLNRFGHGMSFGTVYEVLSREHFSVTGSPEAFCVSGISGDIYEFSYSFNDMPYENGEDGYYYIKNGEKLPLEYYFYNHIKSDFFEEISGMTFRQI